MPRFFTLDQATAMLPRVSESLEQAIVLKREHDRAAQELQAIAQRVSMTGGMIVDRGAVVQHQTRRDATLHRLRETVEEIHSWGVQIKDLESGLIDFPTLFRGDEVLLCWKRGETSIEYWHGLEEGFRGRKRIDADFLEHHQGDLPA